MLQQSPFSPRMIFISHSAKSRVEKRALVRLWHGLKGAGFDVLLDRARLREVTGSSWRSTLNTWMELCDGAVLLIGESARDVSQWTIYEAYPDLALVPGQDIQIGSSRGAPRKYQRPRQRPV